eukprot:COSAG01_NODE_20174_length_967_cov_0.764977_3_plen_83_part_00
MKVPADLSARIHSATARWRQGSGAVSVRASESPPASPSSMMLMTALILLVAAPHTSLAGLFHRPLFASGMILQRGTPLLHDA